MKRKNKLKDDILSLFCNHITYTISKLLAGIPGVARADVNM